MNDKIFIFRDPRSGIPGILVYVINQYTACSTLNNLINKINMFKKFINKNWNED